jgi:hypothetical protein
MLERIFGATKKEKKKECSAMRKVFFMSQDRRKMFQMWKILLKKLGRGTVCGSDVVCTKESRQGTKPEGVFLDVLFGSKIPPPPHVFLGFEISTATAESGCRDLALFTFFIYL